VTSCCMHALRTFRELAWRRGLVLSATTRAEPPELDSAKPPANEKAKPSGSIEGKLLANSCVTSVMAEVSTHDYVIPRHPRFGAAKGTRRDYPRRTVIITMRHRREQRGSSRRIHPHPRRHPLSDRLRFADTGGTGGERPRRPCRVLGRARAWPACARGAAACVLSAGVAPPHQGIEPRRRFRRP
jgi:hypothetical protein